MLNEDRGGGTANDSENWDALGDARSVPRFCGHSLGGTQDDVDAEDSSLCRGTERIQWEVKCADNEARCHFSASFGRGLVERLEGAGKCFWCQSVIRC